MAPVARALALPEEFPVFPLPGALLLPHGKLPLNIFEPRYLAMVEDALGLGRMLGMIQPDDSAAEGAHGPALYRIGCLGRIAGFAETDDGRFQISLTGVARFAVVQELGVHRGYRRIRGNFEPCMADLDPIEAHPAGFDRAALMAALRGYFTHRGFEANW
jgi:Lon protease-like protein